MGSTHRCHMLILLDKLQAAARVHSDGGLSHCVKMLIYEDAVCLFAVFTGYLPFLLLELTNADRIVAKSNILTLFNSLTFDI